MARWLRVLALGGGAGTTTWLASAGDFLLAITCLLAVMAVVTASCAGHFHRRDEINREEAVVTASSAGNFHRRDEENREEGGGDPVWQRSILMGERCQPPQFSGLIVYDDKGNRLPQFPPRSPKLNTFHPSHH